MSRFHLSALRTSVVAVALISLATSSAKASFVSPTPDPFLSGSEVLTSPTAINTPFGYTKVFTISNFNETSNTITGGNDLITYTATFAATFYTDPGLTMNPTSVLLSGTFNVTEFGRTGIFQTGAFSYQVTSSTFTGVVGGQTLTTSLSSPATGTTTITPGPGSNFTIDDPGLAPSQYSVNGGTPTSIGTLGATTTSAVPEPGTLVLCAQSLACLAFFARRRLRKTA